MAQRHSQAIVDAVSELDELGLVSSGSVELRVHQLAPLFKAFLLNRDELFIGFYPVVRRQVKLHDQPHDIYDLMGKDVTLFHHATNDDDTSTGSQYVDEMQSWFETIWTTVAHPAKT